MTFQPAPRKSPSSSWMILPLPRTGPSSRCRLQLMTNMRLSSFSRPASEIAPRLSGSSISPSPQNTQTWRLSVSARPRPCEILEEARLIDRHQRPEAHRHGGELPEVRHQPGVRIGRNALAVDLLAEVLQLLLGETPLDEGAGIDAGRRMALHEHEVAAVAFVRGVPEMHEAGVVEGRSGLERRDMAAEFGAFLVGLDARSPPHSSARRGGWSFRPRASPDAWAADRAGWY